MSAGPAMVPIRVQPRSTSSLGGLALAGHVVDVDVGHPVAAGPGPAAEDAGQADAGEVLGEPVVAVVGDDQGAVDVAVGEVAQRARRSSAGRGQQQHELDVALAPAPGSTPRSVPAKNGSLKTRSSGSGTTTAIESVRRVTRLRAAGLGT